LKIPRVVLLIAAVEVLSVSAVAQTAFRDVDGHAQLANLIPELDDNGKPLVDSTGNMIDKRGPMFTKGPQLPGDLKLSMQDMQQINDAVGFLDCGDEMVGTYSLSSVTLYGNGGQLVAAWHSIVNLPPNAKRVKVDRQIGTFKKPCWLRKQGKSRLTEVDLGLDHGLVQFIPSPTGEIDGALALIRLKKRMAAGLPLDESGTPLPVGTRFVQVSAAQLDRTRTYFIVDPNTEPTVQTCSRRIDRRKGSEILTDCSMTEEASGSVALVRIDGRLSIKAIFPRSGFASADGRPFNVRTEPASYSQGVELTAEVVKQMKNFEAAGLTATSR
jgi:hypothetical protein